MKKITSTFLILLLVVLISNESNAQAFQKGNINIDLGIGFGAYGTTQKLTTEIGGTSVSETNSDGAASFILPLGFEYGVGEKIGIGADLVYVNYTIDEEDREFLNKVGSFDIGAKFNYHLLNSDKNDLFIGFGIGFSSMTIDYETSDFQLVEGVSGSGIYYSLGITDRIFFSDHIGILFNLGYRGYNYSNLEAEFSPEFEEFISTVGVTFSQKWEWKFNGVHIGTGLAIKF